MSVSEATLDSRPQPSQLYRWLVLIFVSLAMFGNYYVYDSINPLERIFLDQLGFSASMFGWLNASYSVAAVAHFADRRHPDRSLRNQEVPDAFLRI